jgi:hypothetical protein
MGTFESNKPSIRQLAWFQFLIDRFNATLLSLVREAGFNKVHSIYLRGTLSDGLEQIP